MIRTAGPGHLEDRTVSSGCNPYLAFAAYIAAGMDGIKRKIDPGKPNLTNMYELTPAQTKKLGIEILPQSLYEALDELDGDQVIKDSLGPIYDEFYDVKKREWNEYHSQVSDWELNRYLTLF